MPYSPPSLHSRALTPCMPLVRCRRPMSSRLRPTPHPASYALLSTRQNAAAFNQPLSFDTSSATIMSYMFSVRSARMPQPPQPSQPGPLAVHAARALPPAHAHRLTSHARLSIRQGKNSLSDANKLLIRCAWAGTSAFASAGYGSSWGPGSCT